MPTHEHEVNDALCHAHPAALLRDLLIPSSPAMHEPFHEPSGSRWLFTRIADFLLAGARAIFVLPSRNSRSLPPARKPSSAQRRHQHILWPSSVFISEKVIFSLAAEKAGAQRRTCKPTNLSFFVFSQPVQVAGWCRRWRNCLEGLSQERPEQRDPPP